MNRAVTNGCAVPQRAKEVQGSVSLEAALTFPMVLFVLLFFVLSIQTVRDTVILGHALDQTADEIALLLPLADVLEGVVDPEAWIREAIPDPFLADLALEGAADLASTVLASPFILKRVAHWSKQTAEGQRCPVPDGEMKLALDFDTRRRICWLILSYRKTLPKDAPWQIVRSRVPIWNAGRIKNQDDGQEEENDDKDSVWMRSNFERGALIREAFGGHLPPFYPVIASWDGAEAVSIKSMDLTAPSYASAAAAEKKVRRHVEALAAFEGIGEEGPSPGEIKRRRLILVIPDNAVPWKTVDVISSWRRMAASYGVTLDLREYGTSHAYEDSG